jgi:hypothetical protein
MTATEFLDIENKDLKKELEKHLLRNKVTGVMRAFAEAYHQEESKELIISDNNGKGWFNSYQEVDLFLFQEIDDFPIINEKTPEANTIEAIKIYAKLHAEAYHQEKMREDLKETRDMYKECFEMFIETDKWDEATLFLSTYGSGLAKDLSKKEM